MSLLNRIINWMTVEPAIGLLMTVTAIVIFATAFGRSRDDADNFWPWLRRVIEASVGAVLFLGLLWAFRSILTTNNTTFHSTHGSLSEATLQSAQSIWGRPHVQRDLAVNHTIETTVQEEIPREDPSLPPLYRNKQVRQLVPQNSLLAFTGQVDMALSEREKGYALYNGFVIQAQFEYDVINDSELDTEAEFAFPLSPGQTLYEDFTILVDGQDISPLLRFSPEQVSWKSQMAPHQRHKVAVSYKSRGMEYFYYQVPAHRQITNFHLKLAVDRLPVSLLNYPEGCLTPTSISPTADQKGSILEWKLDRAVTVAGMGVALLQPQQPGAQVLRVLANSPYALTLLIAMIGLSLLICGQPARFLDLALLAGVYCIQFLTMAALSDFFLGFWGSLVLGAALSLGLTFLLFRRYSSGLIRVLTLALVAFFTIVYPLAGLLTDVIHRNAFDNMVQVGLIVYLFGLTLYTQARPSHLKP
jgi:hypothetical protein